MCVTNVLDCIDFFSLTPYLLCKHTLLKIFKGTLHVFLLIARVGLIKQKHVFPVNSLVANQG